MGSFQLKKFKLGTLVIFLLLAIFVTLCVICYNTYDSKKIASIFSDNTKMYCYQSEEIR
jgi:hypothetical protein